MRNMTTIVLDGVNECLARHVSPLLFSECLQLENVTFKNCKIVMGLDII
ncbi:F-box/FBD/LRR-repeat protein, partial [Trifolium medium]|nr:F-box/FBD/LRR-repeat protein [Trifolium medium]